MLDKNDRKIITEIQNELGLSFSKEAIDTMYDLLDNNYDVNKLLEFILEIKEEV